MGTNDKEKEELCKLLIEITRTHLLLPHPYKHFDESVAYLDMDKAISKGHYMQYHVNPSDKLPARVPGELNIYLRREAIGASHLLLRPDFVQLQRTVIVHVGS